MLGQTLSYSIVGGADASKFTINAATGSLAFVTAPNFEAPADADFDNIYDVVVQVSDGNGGVDTQGLAVAVTNINEGPGNAPVITSNGGGTTASVTLAENTPAVTTVTATDADGTTPRYLIAGGADAALFSIDPTTGELSFLNAPDFEHPLDTDANNIYEVIVQATDGVNTDSQVLSVVVTNQNDNTPVIGSNGGGSNGFDQHSRKRHDRYDSHGDRRRRDNADLQHRRRRGCRPLHHRSDNGKVLVPERAGLRESDGREP